MTIRAFAILVAACAMGCSGHSSSTRHGDMAVGDLSGSGNDLQSASGDLNVSSDDLLQSGSGDLARAGDGGALCSTIQGTFHATAVSCNGTPLGSTDVANAHWFATVNGTAASFSEDPDNLCTLVSSGTIECLSNDEFTLIWSNANTCTPASCAVWGVECGATPTNYELTWITSDVTSTGFVATSTLSPNGSPTPLTTCTSLHLSNPIQITWTKQ